MEDRDRVSGVSPYEARYGFCRALRVGSTIHVAGTAPINEDGGCSEGAEAQAARCFEIIAEALDALGAGLADTVRTRMYITDPADADAVGQVHARYCGEAQPAATMVVVAALLDPAWRVEIELDAVADD